MNGEVRLLLFDLMPDDINMKSLQESSISFPFPFPFFSSVSDVSFLFLSPPPPFLSLTEVLSASPILLPKYPRLKTPLRSFAFISKRQNRLLSHSPSFVNSLKPWEPNFHL